MTRQPRSLKALILDDMPERHKALSKRVLGLTKGVGAPKGPIRATEVLNAYSYSQAKTMLEEHKEDIVLICLDHDLADHDSSIADMASTYSGYGGSSSSRFLTGYDFVMDEIPEEEEMPRAHVAMWVHSHNPAGAQRMKQGLEKKGYAVLLSPAPGA